ncbi:efflux RND transporter permease subunit [Chromatiaceae bacterium AAb-1]|nr:efflux RND transporter permease subunit [Chromatiaceae bacterium AAb-1]
METNKGLIAWFTHNSVAANLLMWIILIVGITAAFTIKKQMFPEIMVEQVNIRVPYLGAAPQEVESGVIDKIEESLRSINGIKRIRSTAVQGMGTVRAEISSGYNVQEVMEEIKMQVAAISSLPEQTERPVVYRAKWQSNALWLSLHGDVDERTLKELAKDIRDDIKKLPGVSSVDVVATRDYEISVELTEHKLKEYGLTFDQVVAAIRGSSVDIPGGSIKSESGNILLRAKGQAYYSQDFENIVLMTFNDGTKLTLRDIAVINDGFIERDGISTFDGKDSALIRVNAVGNDNVLSIAEQVRGYVVKKSPQLPDTLTLNDWGDSSYYLQDRLDLMTGNLFTGALLVLIALTLFLEVRVAFWVMVGIPICFCGAMALLPMPMFDVSINMISLFAFILVLGIVVDDAIIIGESAYSEIEKRGMSTESVIIGAKKVAMPATFGVMTTIAAFVPMLMVDGVMAPIWESIAWVVVLCLVFSLIESKLILPSHIAHMNTRPWDENRRNIFYRLGKNMSKGIRKARHFSTRALQSFVQNRYRPFVEKCIKFRYVTLTSFVAMLILMFGLVSGGFIRWVFFPDIPSDFMSARFEMEEGASNEATILALQNLEQSLLAVDKDIEKDQGAAVVKHRLAFLNSETAGEIVVELQKGENREIDAFEIARLWREAVPEIPGMKTLKINASDGGGGSDISLQLRSNNLENLKNAALELRQALASYNGIYDIEDNLLGGNDEVVLHLKPEAHLLGITLSDLARQVRYGFYGAEAQRVQRDGEEVKVMVRYPRSERSSIGNLENMRIRTADGGEIPFSQIAYYDLQPSYSAINRVNGERAVIVTASADKAIVEPNRIVAEIRSKVIPELESKYQGVTGGLDGASQDDIDSLIQLAMATVIAMFGIYALLAIPLRSYVQPMIIMSVIPFGLVGAALGHLLLGLDMSIMSIFGLIALSGVVINDSLIMVDFVNRAREQGVPLTQAVVDSGCQRFRAIFLTSLTTFVGLFPIVLERSLQAKMVVPMAVSLAFGIVFATVITLLLIPALYIILEDVKGIFKRKEPEVAEPQLAPQLSQPE